MLTFLLPFLVMPYVSRVLTPDGVGLYSYTNSIVNYFLIFAGMGMSVYGTRQIACVRGDKEKLNKTFSALFYFKGFFSLAAALVYGVALLFVSDKYRLCLYIQTIMILATFFDISWFFAGVENFRISLVTTVLSKLLTIAATFLFVKSPADVWVHVLITSCGLLATNAMMWTGVKSKAKLVKVPIKEVFFYTKSVFVVFISFIAVEVYTVLDKTMIGLLSSETQVGYYTYAEQFAKAGLGIIGAISSVLYPYMSSLREQSNDEEFRKQFHFSVMLISLIGVAASFGIAGIAKEFIPWMLGEEYETSISLLMILSPLTFIVSLGNIISRAYLLPSKKEKLCNVAVITAAVTNVLFNVLLIPKYEALGACIGTLFAELSATLVYLFCSRKEFAWKGYGVALVKYMVAGFSMYAAVRVLGEFLGVAVWVTLVEVAVGVTVYGIALLLLKDEVAQKGVQFFKAKLKK